MQDGLPGPTASIPQFDKPIVGGLSGTEYTQTKVPQSPEALSPSPAGELSNHPLLRRSLTSGQDVATQLYRRDVKRPNTLVARQCSANFAVGEGGRDIVRSAFASFLRRIGPGCYDTPDGDELWKLLLVIALHKIRGKATDHHAAKRDLHRTINGVKGRTHLESQADVRESWYAHLELVLEEILERLPPQNRVMVKLRIDGCEVAEVARLTGRSRRSVERILQESRLKLGAFLRKED